MDCTPAELQQAWRALKATSVRLDPLLPRSEGSRTGYQLQAARERLISQGLAAARADAMLHQAISSRFGAFADSWDSYIDQRGWLIDLCGAGAELREQVSSRFPVAPLLDSAETLRADPAAALTNLQQWGPLLKSAGELARGRETGAHPAAELMVARYGLHPELAKAVLLHSRMEPWWAHIALAAAWLIALSVFLLALADPHNPGFENESVGGVGPLHYIALPLFALMFLAAQVWLLRTRPARQRQWRAQLARYAQAWEGERAG